MANTQSAKKSAIQNEKRRQRNLARQSAIKTAIKKVIVALDERASDSQQLLLDAVAKIARAQNKGLLHKNTASRKISRLMLRANQAQTVSK